MKNKKNIATVGLVGAMLLGFTGTAFSTTPAVAEFTKPNVQTLSFKKPLSIVETIEKRYAFERLQVEIIESKPWLKLANKSRTLSDSELISILKSVGFQGNALKMAWAVVQKESTARPFAHNDNPSTGDNSYGLFQINMRGSMGPDRREKYGLESNEDLFDPVKNATIAYKMSNGGKNWSSWTTHKRAKAIMNEFPG